jgi:uncharacterized membrane protein (UPF0127 family)
VLLLFGVLLAGCDKAAEPVGGPPVDPGEPTQAQPTLPTIKLWVRKEAVNAEMALTFQQQRTGMMFRTNRLPEDAGMLFPLSSTGTASFWMKNCPVPLSAAYIDEAGVIQEIHEFQPNNTNAVTSAESNIRFVLEESQGWFARHNIQPGVAVATERGPLMKAFFGKN